MPVIATRMAEKRSTLDMDIKMSKAEDSGGSGDGSGDGSGGEGDGVQLGRAEVRVSKPDGSPLPAATITISEVNGGYQESKSAKDHGISQTFENVPMTDLQVVIEATGFEKVVIDVDESDFGSEVTHGW